MEYIFEYKFFIMAFVIFLGLVILRFKKSDKDSEKRIKKVTSQGYRPWVKYIYIFMGLIFLMQQFSSSQ